MSLLVSFLHCNTQQSISHTSAFTLLISDTVTHGFTQKSVKSINHASKKNI